MNSVVRLLDLPLNSSSKCVCYYTMCFKNTAPIYFCNKSANNIWIETIIGTRVLLQLQYIWNKTLLNSIICLEGVVCTKFSNLQIMPPECSDSDITIYQNLSGSVTEPLLYGWATSVIILDPTVIWRWNRVFASRVPLVVDSMGGIGCWQVYDNSTGCSELCQCHTNESVICHRLPCTPSVACKHHNTVYGISCFSLQRCVNNARIVWYPRLQKVILVCF